MSDDISSKSVCVIDGGQFVEVAIRLAREFGKVYFHNPELIEGFPTVAKSAIGKGFKEITWVRDLWKIKDKVDLFIFLDCQNSGIQLELESQGKRVIGSRNGDTLENERIEFKDIQKNLGLNVPKHVIVNGLEQLREHLKSVEDRWIKFNRFRGTFETEHHVNYELSKNWLNKLTCDLGPLSDTIRFLVEEPIRGKVEIGYDGFFFGDFPDKTLFGIERKSKSYIGGVKDYKDLDPRLLEINSALASEYRKHGYKNFNSTEVRIAEDDENFEDGEPVLIEPTCRIPSPPFEGEIEIYTELGKMLWFGAVGECIPVKTEAQFAVICRFSHDDPPEGFRSMQLPEEERKWFKLYNAFKKDGAYHIAPDNQGAKRIGCVVGIGDSIEDALEHCHDNLELIDEQPISSEWDSLVDAVKALKSAEEQDISITDQPIPEPETVVAG